MDNNKPTYGQAYPTYHLVDALQIGEVVKNCGGTNVSVDKSQIASHLKAEDDSPSFVSKLATARCFHVIEGRGSYTLTEAAKKYFSPHADSEKRASLLAFLVSPPAFAKIIEKFDGHQIPSGKYLVNVFETIGGVPSSWSGRVAAIFVKAVSDTVDIVDSQGILRFATALQGTPRAITEQSQKPDRIAYIPPEQAQAADELSRVLGWKSGDSQQPTLILDKAQGRTFTFKGPITVTRAEYDRICKWLEYQMIVEDGQKPE